MANISDAIEQFILSVIGDDDTIRLSRNELANYFSVAPSQINYVLATRFNLDRGYVIESKRGGGGFVTVVRLDSPKDSPICDLLRELDVVKDLTYQRVCHMTERLLRNGTIEDKEAELIKSALSDKALAIPCKSEGLRKNIFKEILIGLLRR